MKEIQCLIGQVAVLGRFISRATDRCLPFFQQLKGHKKAEWTLDCEQAFQQSKQYLGSPPLLSKHEEEPLFLYLVVSSSAVSSALIREVEGKQRPVYYISKAMVPAETRYLSMEKLALSLVVSARRLRPYFQKILCQGYFWPTIREDFKSFVQRCNKCQRFAVVPRQPVEEMTLMSRSWQFAQWGIDIIRPLPPGKGQTKFAIVAVDYFTKWAEAEPVRKITEQKVTDFVWKNIICRFRISCTIVSNNGRQFDNDRF
ncbi:uncharacterized protein LOC131224597 [Magnolia sinica]|uniref:uncharacterized protein LOC131224597 n=1 Tax=Magnolia sinica TaxID=86752 RepID=UPI00265801BD|nr:uncharacterized protein LOC131224597 [Magnolia sinica]